jgi:hypothetical protein
MKDKNYYKEFWVSKTDNILTHLTIKPKSNLN